ncbi:MAG TPA: hypothetical protein VGO45_03740 [Bacteroidia bacterium]|nr:hypothetical protein [Bacteroidia bacterium]
MTKLIDNVAKSTRNVSKVIDNVTKATRKVTKMISKVTKLMRKGEKIKVVLLSQWTWNSLQSLFEVR